MNTYPNFMAAAMQQPLYINDFYEKSPIPDFFQKASRQATVGVDPHLSSFYHTGNAHKLQMRNWIGQSIHINCWLFSWIAAYGQHTGFPSSGYGFPTNDFFEKTSNLPHIQSQSQAFGAATPPIIHMPSPNYPYGYNEHHRRQNYMPSDFAFFPNHHGMFDHR